MKNDTLKGQYRINEQIRAKEVRIVGDDIEPKVYPIFQALKLAEEKELDLVEISPNAQPPVCRVIVCSLLPDDYPLYYRMDYHSRSTYGSRETEYAWRT